MDVTLQGQALDAQHTLAAARDAQILTEMSPQQIAPAELTTTSPDNEETAGKVFSWSKSRDALEGLLNWRDDRVEDGTLLGNFTRSIIAITGVAILTPIALIEGVARLALSTLALPFTLTKSMSQERADSLNQGLRIGLLTTINGMCWMVKCLAINTEVDTENSPVEQHFPFLANLLRGPTEQEDDDQEDIEESQEEAPAMDQTQHDTTPQLPVFTATFGAPQAIQGATTVQRAPMEENSITFQAVEGVPVHQNLAQQQPCLVATTGQEGSRGTSPERPPITKENLVEQAMGGHLKSSLIKRENYPTVFDQLLSDLNTANKLQVEEVSQVDEIKFDSDGQPSVEV